MRAPPEISAHEPHDRLGAALLRCAGGDVPANVALMQIFAATASPEEARHALRNAHASFANRGENAQAGRLADALALWARIPEAYPTVRRIVEIEGELLAADPANEVTSLAMLFDRATAVSPEASVALYSLGDADLLEAATREIVARMAGWGLLGPDRTALDIGCGIGRLLSAVSPHLRFVCGLDVSARMIAIARRRCAALANVGLLVTSGESLSALADQAFDLIYAVDSFPYLMRADPAIAQRHVGDARRLLRPGGSLLILNFSYRGDPALDRHDLAGLARQAGFRLPRNGTREFSLWDGLAFRLDRAGE